MGCGWGPSPSEALPWGSAAFPGPSQELGETDRVCGSSTRRKSEKLQPSQSHPCNTRSSVGALEPGRPLRLSSRSFAHLRAKEFGLEYIKLEVPYEKKAFMNLCCSAPIREFFYASNYFRVFGCCFSSHFCPGVWRRIFQLWITQK